MAKRKKTKFKIGDKVRLNSPKHWFHNKPGTITQVGGSIYEFVVKLDLSDIDTKFIAVHSFEMKYNNITLIKEKLGIK